MSFLYWIEDEEIMAQSWKNLIRKVKAPKLPTNSIEPFHVEGIELLLNTCESNYAEARDKDMMFGLLDTDARAIKLLNINTEDVKLATRSVMILQAKGGYPRMGFLERKAIRVIHAYLRAKRDTNFAL